MEENSEEFLNTAVHTSSKSTTNQGSKRIERKVYNLMIRPTWLNFTSLDIIREINQI